MKLIITTENEDVFELEVHGELEVETLEALCEIETGKSRPTGYLSTTYFSARQITKLPTVNRGGSGPLNIEWHLPRVI